MASIQAAIAQDMKAEKPVIVKKEQEKREKNVQETPMQLKSACAYTNFSFISVQNYNSTKIFFPVSEETFLRAKQMLGSCKTCICALTEFGPYNEKNRQLFEYAKKLGKI